MSGLNREQRRRMERKHKKVFRYDPDDAKRLDQLVEMGALLKWVRTDENDSYNVMTNNGTTINVPDKYFADWFLRVVDEMRGQLIAMAEDGSETANRIKELQAELEIYQGKRDAPVGYTPSLERAKVATAELNQILTDLAQNG